ADNVMVYAHPVGAPAGRVFDVRDHGAAGDGVSDDTAAIQAALDAAEGTGGSVYLGDGVFLSGTIRLRSDTTLHIDDDAVLLGSQDDARYPRLTPSTTGTPRVGGNIEKALVYSAGADGVRIDGGGTIDGNGRTPAWAGGPERTRPTALFLTTGRDVSVRNVHVKDAGMWTLVSAEVEGLVVADVNVDSNLAPNRDGIETIDCHDVLIERVSVWSDDDSIVFKSYSGGPSNGIPGTPDAQRPFGVDGVTVRLATIGRSERANGVKFGTASHGAFRDVVVEDVLVKNTYHTGIVVQAIDGAVVHDLTFRRVTMHGVGEPILLLNGRRTEYTGAPRWIDTVRFEDISGGVRLSPIADGRDRRRYGSAISGQTDGGTTHRIYSLLFSNVRLTVQGGLTSVPPDPAEYTGVYPEAWMWKPPSYGWYFRHVTGLTTRATTATPSSPDTRRETELRDVLT
ncbi:MAG TPA: glycosyl hydrolase family 28 protein, partial [Euzebyales bacterium]|nr:glycosyl hydrolase family 28 protein [Euzebyales bacterium]